LGTTRNFIMLEVGTGTAIRDCSEKTCNLLETKSNHVIF
jgi:hypothetical protein